MILTMTKYHENLLNDSPLSLFSTVNFFPPLKTDMILKRPNETFLRITRYLLCFYFWSFLHKYIPVCQHRGFYILHDVTEELERSVVNL